jgi:hypothetical protein
MGVGRGANNPTLQKRKSLRSLQEIQLDFEEAKAQAGLWSQGKKKKKKKKKKRAMVGIFLFAAASRPALWPTHPPTQGARGGGLLFNSGVK